MCYFDNATNRTQVTVDSICHELKNPQLGKVDLVVGTGFSGTLLLAAIYIQSGIPFGAIRKDKNSTHSHKTVETGGMEHLKGHERYVIIDDFTSSGATLSGIMVKMSGHECAGIILYQEAKCGRKDRLSDYLNTPLICLAHDIEELVIEMRTEKETSCV